MWTILFFLLIMLVIVCANSWQKLAIWRWRKTFAIDTVEPVFEKLYGDINGFALSREARQEHDAIDYIYGEIVFGPFIALLSLAKPNQNTVFYDLGSGTGKAVLASAMVFNMEKCVGIELFQSLHNAARQQCLALHALDDFLPATGNIRFIHDNFLSCKLEDATLVYINATGFIGETWTLVSHRIEETATCLTVISTSKPLRTKAFIVTKVTSVQMSWGVVRAYIHQRVKG